MEKNGYLLVYRKKAKDLIESVRVRVLEPA